LPDRQAIGVWRGFDLWLRGPWQDQAVREAQTHAGIAPLLHRPSDLPGCCSGDDLACKLLPAADSAVQKLTRVLQALVHSSCLTAKPVYKLRTLNYQRTAVAASTPA